MNKILKLTVNGVAREVAAPDNAILLDVLRESCRLTGTKRGCDMGTCGCCTVLIDGENRLSCLTLAAQAAGKEITTVEALGTPNRLHPIQAAFSEIGGSQCGFCTPGFIMTTKALLDRNPDPDDKEIREAISGNLCRCTGYIKIIDAVKVAAKELAPEPARPTPPIAAPARRAK
ncbi:MAG: (2Fe-2S)-binding protein [Euryarchaeota archaeon]|nr:(2Fe-2S)-binding protein [Euryarchaeota archaeon]